MEQLLFAREVAVRFFKRFEMIFMPLLKFILGFFVFSQIMSIGYVHSAVEPFTDILTPPLLNMMLAFVFTVMPMNMNWLIIIFAVTAQFSENIELATAVFLFLLFIFLFYARMAPKESVLIIITVIAFHFNVPYIIPLIIGLYFPISAAIPVTIGVFVNAQIPVVFGLMPHVGALGDFDDMDFVDIVTELPAAFSEVYSTLIASITGTQAWIATAVIFIMVIILVYFVSRQSIDFAKEIAIVSGCVMLIFGFVVTTIFIGDAPSIGIVILGTIISGVLAYIVRFFDSVLDYHRAESVQFEDDVNYYHVKIIPKVTVTKQQRSVKRIRSDSEGAESGGDEGQ